MNIRVVSREELTVTQVAKSLDQFAKQEKDKTKKLDSITFVLPHIVRQIDRVKDYLTKQDTQAIIDCQTKNHIKSYYE